MWYAERSSAKPNSYSAYAYPQRSQGRLWLFIRIRSTNDVEGRSEQMFAFNLPRPSYT